jgi:hypothetical protein
VQGQEEILGLITTDNEVSHKGGICWAEGAAGDKSKDGHVAHPFRCVHVG